MTARTNGTATGGKRFELPALDFNFSSLTEGTDIPPPLPSPVEEKVPTPPKTPTAEEKKDEAPPPNVENVTTPQNAGTHGGEYARPESRSNGSFVDSKKAKRSSGWFSRLRSNEAAGNKRASVVGVPRNTIEEKRPMGPPPPMIPELAELKSKVEIGDEGGFGADLFKDIK